MNFKFENFSDFELIKKKLKLKEKAKVVNLIIFFPLHPSLALQVVIKLTMQK